MLFVIECDRTGTYLGDDSSETVCRDYVSDIVFAVEEQEYSHEQIFEYVLQGKSENYGYYANCSCGDEGVDTGNLESVIQRYDKGQEADEIFDDRECCIGFSAFFRQRLCDYGKDHERCP